MVKYFIIMIWGSLLMGQEVSPPKSVCSSEIVLKARTEGYRSLTLGEKIQFTLDLRKCEPAELKKAIKKEVNQKQLTSDAKAGETFVGKTSSFAYCVMAVILYWTFA